MPVHEGRRDVDLTFAGPDIELSSVAFSRRIADAHLFHEGAVAPDVGIVTINLRGAGFLGVRDIATLAVIARALASTGRYVRILWPLRRRKDRPSRLERVLDALGFRRLFQRRDVEPLGSWKDYVHFDATPDSQFRQRPNYVRLSWFDRDAFDGVPDDVWLAVPLVAPNVADDFEDLLRREGYLDDESIRTLIHVMFLELGWNSVLHSDSRPGTGYGVFAAQALPRQQQNQAIEAGLHFCLVDLGLGIPAALCHQYRNSHKDYHLRDAVAESGGVLRWALDPDSTSRPYFPPGIPEQSHRGLALVVKTLGEDGQLELRSTGAHLTVTKGKATSDATHEDAPIPGTQITGFLACRVRTRRTHAVRQAINAIDVFPFEEAGRGRTPPFALDLGFEPMHFHTLSGQLDALGKSVGSGTVTLFNVGAPWSQVESMAPLLAPSVPPGLRFVLVGGAEKVVEIDHGISEARATPWEYGDYLDLARRANTAFLERGFAAQKGQEAGFFSGCVHLLGGVGVDRFFALARNLDVAGDPYASDANRRRWSETATVAVRNVSSILRH